MYPLKASITWAMILFVLSQMTGFVDSSFWERLGSLLLAVSVARLSTRIVAPVSAILFKWLVIGRYKPGVYRM